MTMKGMNEWTSTPTCETMTSFFLKNNCIPHIKPPANISPFLDELYGNILDANRWIESSKETGIDDFYNLQMMEVRKDSNIPMPKTMQISGTFVAEGVLDHIRKTAVFSSTYSINMLDRQVIIHFVFENAELDVKWKKKEPNIQAINAYVDNMLIWLHVANKYTEKSCAPSLTIFVYLTSLEKLVPKVDATVISATHVNTGATFSCPVNAGEIIVYRHEEWFKVFIHESMHVLGLDFSSMDTSASQSKLRETFHIPTPILMFEAYTEFWARVMNVLIASFRWTQTQTQGQQQEQQQGQQQGQQDAGNGSTQGQQQRQQDDGIKLFIQYATFLLDYERVHCFFQMAKVLEHMNIEYVDLHSDPTLLDRYKEESNVFVYYVLTVIMLNNYPKFIHWCGTNNVNLIQFTQTQDHQLLFCEYIKMNFKTKEMLSSIQCTNRLIKKISIHHHHPRNKKIKLILTNLRMSLCEIRN